VVIWNKSILNLPNPRVTAWETIRCTHRTPQNVRLRLDRSEKEKQVQERGVRMTGKVQTRENNNSDANDIEEIAIPVPISSWFLLWCGVGSVLDVLQRWYIFLLKDSCDMSCVVLHVIFRDIWIQLSGSHPAAFRCGATCVCGRNFSSCVSCCTWGKFQGWPVGNHGDPQLNLIIWTIRLYINVQTKITPA
jgi:hypothetical protein